MRGETAGKPLKYAGNGDFRRGTEARIINNLEMRMRRRRSALFSRPRGRTTAAARRGAHIRRIRKNPGNARITAFLRLLDGMSRSAPSRKSQQQTKRTGFAALEDSIADEAPEGKRAKRANRALNRAGINSRGQKQGFGGADRRAGRVTSR